MQQPGVVQSREAPTVAVAKTMFRRIFVPVDYTMGSHRAVGAALELQRAFGSTVCLFHVQHGDGTDDFLGGIGSPATGGDWVANATARLERFVENVAPGARDRVEFLARIGGQSREVELVKDEALAWDATMIVACASCHASFFRSEGERMVHDAALPVLVVPAADR